MIRVVLLTVMTILMLNASAFAQRMSYGKVPTVGEKGPADPEGVAYQQRRGEMIPIDLEFYDHNSQPVKLRDLMNGKPTILVLAYYRCPKLCNLVLTGVLDALNVIRKGDPTFVAGGPFNVIAVSIDPREAPMTLARPKRLNFLQDYDGRSEDTPGWWFLSANHGQGTDVKAADRKIHELTDAAGYQYTLRARNKNYYYNDEQGEWLGALDSRVLQDLPKDYDYQHASGVVVLTPEGKISSYLLGINYNANDVRLALVEASGGKVGSFFEKNVSQYCYVYDDVKGHYRLTMRWMAVVFTPFMLTVAFIAFRTIRRGLREQPIALPRTGPVTPPETIAPVHNG